ncbi:tRNA glutamyl-Q(34) synthetase GluQRS [Pseudoalteromonas xiamenensis]|uniref:tRNA glutamyl-Q(34) synthetase GluQRS n=1 Tax=Pseudoalteromonas xiamenensis TaxID=882626 RepID=UPI0027E3E99A|nr:tRNA glutamyl-Q(34) synthetase GluQRS [Pseudoalteromonas xiamenensis]WMN61105.1 tRNA glutamyl-Q(34) synthetase GluQRS [Pseudoalteromonas xiamenensis]
MLTPDIQGSYRGRFAPSPSGPLHFGSLIAATASYLDAKINQGRWLVRIEDIDTPRVVKGADTDILHTLDAFGLHWDEDVVWQSQRHSLYQDVLSTLNTRQELYACTCTRKQIKALGGLYTGHCLPLNKAFERNALRITQTHPIVTFDDLIQGQVTTPAELANEDYIVKRSDGLYAYQLVVVVDDHLQGISHVIRGADLVEPTSRQMSLFSQLCWPIPQYGHVPLAVQSPGFKLSKQNHAPAVDKKNPAPALLATLQFLGLFPDNHVDIHSVDVLLKWAIEHYQRESIPKTREIVVKLSDKGYQFSLPTS